MWKRLFWEFFFTVSIFFHFCNIFKIGKIRVIFSNFAVAAVAKFPTFNYNNCFPFLNSTFQMLFQRFYFTLLLPLSLILKLYYLNVDLKILFFLCYFRSFCYSRSASFLNSTFQMLNKRFYFFSAMSAPSATPAGPYS